MSTRLAAAYTGGFLLNRRIRRILELSGWRLAPLADPRRADAVAVWGRRPVSARGQWVARRWNKPLLNVEDAFLRSVRPGPSGERALGLLIDDLALHYDAARPSRLERMLAESALTPQAETRARDGIAFLRDEGLSKYSDWSPEAPAPAPGYVLVIDQTAGDAAIAHAGASAESFAAMLAAARAEHPGARLLLRTHPVTAAGHRRGHFGPEDLDQRTQVCAAPVNPWTLLAGATAVYCVSSQLGFEAILAGHRPVVFGQPFYAGWGLSDDRIPVPRRGRALSVEALFHAALIDYPAWYDPHHDRLCAFEDVARALEAQARARRENARPLLCTGMKPWKHAPMRAFLRGEAGPPAFENDPARAVARASGSGRTLLLWAGKETPEIRAAAEARAVPLWRAEDGFLRSVGLGAQLLPAASLVIDDLGIYFDPTRESRLERIIAASADLPSHARKRAEALQSAIVAARLTKYNVGSAAPRFPSRPGRRRVLVPGQVEDDASIRLGTGAVGTNLELLRRARALFPDDVVIYKPHPDIEAGLRQGLIRADEMSRLADHVARDTSAAEAMDQADVVVTMTSLMGFEALLRGREVHCFGTPFYAGWGLTRDHAAPCPRRVARPDLTALVHAALIAYPRYFDAETGLACAPEVILSRLSARAGSVSRHATRRHKLVAGLQYRLRGLAPLWRN
ncbi:capsular polysaccharide biosynthesis protein [Halovulum marinum]|uniref:capsular polysaccharide biosynthesis protein n=1 Tax=Halovulum marinum TaxID=2662447 RepID=UPI002D796979|nr:capsular polysaccharide biosynthesis protein [Halovulum marinum]